MRLPSVVVDATFEVEGRACSPKTAHKDDFDWAMGEKNLAIFPKSDSTSVVAMTIG